MDLELDGKRKKQNETDCLVWCLVEVPSETYTFSEVIDTSITNSYAEESIEVIKTIKKGGFTEWREIVCENDVTSDLNTKIQSKLIEAWYDIPNGASGDFGGASKSALVKYQKDNGLPVGNLNTETLKHMDIY